MSLERPLRNSVFTGLKSDLERNSSKSGAFLFSLMLAEKGAAGEDKIAALKSPMSIVSQAGGIGSRECDSSSKRWAMSTGSEEEVGL